MTQQMLDVVQAGSHFQKMGGIGMAQSMDCRVGQVEFLTCDYHEALQGAHGDGFLGLSHSQAHLIR